MRLLDLNVVHSSLCRIAKDGSRIFGGNSHGFRLNPCLSDSDLQKFEQSHAIKLPAEYSYFLRRVGNGGAGPYYGIFPLGLMDGTGSSLEVWNEEDGFIGKLSEPFPLTQSWNDITLQPNAGISYSDQNENEYDRQVEAFDKVYWNPTRMNGAIPICHLGCALRIWLIITGEQAGYLWRDGRAEYTGITPLLLQNGSPATFSTWYEEWLDHPLPAPPVQNR